MEAISLRVADDVRSASAFTDRVFERLLMIGERRRVTVSGDIGAPVPEGVIRAWLAHLKGTAAEITGTGRHMTLPTPGGGEIVLADGDMPEGKGVWLSGSPITGDEWARVDRMIVDKAEQARSSEPLWLRIDETHFLWDLTIPATWPRPQMHEALASNIATRIERLGHVAGVVLSRPPQMAQDSEDSSWKLLDGQALGLIRQVREESFRESVLVAGPHPAGVHQLAEWRNWYGAEGTWLDWALQRLGFPPVARLLRLT